MTHKHYDRVARIATRPAYPHRPTRHRRDHRTPVGIGIPTTRDISQNPTDPAHGHMPTPHRDAWTIRVSPDPATSMTRHPSTATQGAESPRSTGHVSDMGYTHHGRIPA